MKFKLDENVPWILKTLIEGIGQHEVKSVFHENIVSIDDKILNKKFFDEKRILITLNSYFINSNE